MLVGDYGHLPKSTLELKCAYAGCKAKTMKVNVGLLGTSTEVSFVGTSYPVFELPPHSRDKGRDLDSDTVLRVRWDRLNFYATHPLMGPIRLKIDSQRSGGRVHSRKSGRVKDTDLWFSKGLDLPDDGYFPAVNENRLFFNLEVPRFGLLYRNETPVVNGAIIDQIPPDNIEYELHSPVRFKSGSPMAPAITLENCRMAMALLERVGVEVSRMEVAGDITTVTFEIKVDDPPPGAQLGIVGDSTSNVGFAPVEQFFDIGAERVTKQVAFDLSGALWPGTASVCFVLVHPFESRSASVLTFDLEELRTGTVLDGFPEFADQGLVDKSASSRHRKGIAQ